MAQPLQDEPGAEILRSEYKRSQWVIRAPGLRLHTIILRYIPHARAGRENATEITTVVNRHGDHAVGVGGGGRPAWIKAGRIEVVSWVSVAVLVLIPTLGTVRAAALIRVRRHEPAELVGIVALVGGVIQTRERIAPVGHEAPDVGPAG